MDRYSSNMNRYSRRSRNHDNSRGYYSGNHERSYLIDNVPPILPIVYQQPNINTYPDLNNYSNMPTFNNHSQKMVFDEQKLLDGFKHQLNGITSELNNKIKHLDDEQKNFNKKMCDKLGEMIKVEGKFDSMFAEMNSNINKLSNIKENKIKIETKSKLISPKVIKKRSKKKKTPKYVETDDDSDVEIIDSDYNDAGYDDYTQKQHEVPVFMHIYFIIYCGLICVYTYNRKQLKQ